MYDLHCHLLPGIDDGPSTWAETLALAQCLVKEGVTLVAATPHSYGSFARRYDPLLIRERTHELRHHLHAQQLPLEVISGTEITVSEQMVERLATGKLLPYGTSRTILLEGRKFCPFEELEAAILALLHGGYRIVLAHPEHLDCVEQTPNILIPLVEQGVVTQLTAASLAGARGRPTQALCEDLLLHGLAHLIASDAHGVDGPRAPMLAKGYQAAVALVGARYARHLVTTIPLLLIQDRPLPAVRPRPIRQRRG